MSDVRDEHATGLSLGTLWRAYLKADADWQLAVTEKLINPNSMSEAKAMQARRRLRQAHRFSCAITRRIEEIESGHWLGDLEELREENPWPPT
jgi:hypothetical protein